MASQDLDHVWFRHMGDVADTLGFLDLGGHSLKAVRLAADLQRDAGIVIPVATILRDNPSLADLKARVNGRDNPPQSRVIPQRSRPSRVQPLVVSQQAIWTDQQFKDDPGAYAVAGALAVSERIDDQALRAAAAPLAQRHDALRAHIEQFASGPALVFGRSAAPVEVDRFDSGTALDEAVMSLAARIDTASAPLGRIGILSRNEGDVIIAVFDHLIADAEALDVFFTDLAAAYGRARDHVSEPHTDRIAESGPSFASFLAERRHHERDAHTSALDHWRTVLSGVDLSPGRPFAQKDPETRKPQPRAARCRLNATRTRRLEEGLRQRKATTATALVSAVGGQLGRALDRSHCLLGVPASQRSTTDAMDLMGMALGVLPVVVPTEGSTRQRLDAARDALLDGQEFTTVAVAEAIRAAGGTFDPVDPPLAAWVNDLTSRRAPDGFGGTSEYVDHELVRPLFPLSFYLHRIGEELELVAFTDGEIFSDPHYLDTLADQVVAELEALAQDSSHTRVGVPSPLPGRNLDAVNTLDRALGVAGIHGDGEEKNPAQVESIVDSQREAWAKAGASAGDVALVRARRNIDLLPTLLGAWKAGLITAIVDNKLPRAAIDRRAAAAEAHWMIDSVRDAQPVRLDRPGNRHTMSPGHILFTSGTTGEPKPVLMDLAATLGAIFDHIDAMQLGPHDHTGFISGMGHDPMLRDLLVPHLTGARLHIPNDSDIRDPRRLSEFVSSSGITVLHATPSLLELLLAGVPTDGAAPDLRTIVCGGEPLSTELLSRLRKAFPTARIHNAYGCTESAQVASVMDVTHVDNGAARVPISDQCGQTRVHVVRDGELAPIGESGEVVIVGPYVTPESNGYHHTGDRGRLDTEGRIHLDGRLDRQLSIGGHRIAPETIEAIALATSGVSQAWAGLPPSTPDTLTLAIVASNGDDPRNDVTQQLRFRLPAHEVPGRILLVHDFELDAHHKRIGPGRTTNDDPPTPGYDSAPQLQQRIIELIRATSGISVSPHQNFFDAGLKSLQLLHIHRALHNEMGMALTPIALFEHPNVQALARAMETPPDARTQGSEPPRQRQPRRGAGDRAKRRAALYANLEETHRG